MASEKMQHAYAFSRLSQQERAENIRVQKQQQAQCLRTYRRYLLTNLPQALLGNSVNSMGHGIP